MIIVGDALHIPLADEFVQCVVTSPPYWGLRDYGNDSQLGLEPTPEGYIDNMVQVFREVRRVLKDDGVVWLNLGDSYFGDSPVRMSSGEQFDPDKQSVLKRSSGGMRRSAARAGGLKPKDLIGIPWRVALALQADGWWLRRDIIWAKPNPMPESVTDRCTSSHEYIFMLTKSARYYYDADAIREPHTVGSIERMKYGRSPGHKWADGGPGDHSIAKSLDNALSDGGANKRSVWTVTTKPYPEAHYATFPEEIPRICILASSRPGDVVLDPFAGSGTTGKVAIDLARKAVCMDISQEYAAGHMKKRMQTTMGFAF